MSFAIRNLSVLAYANGFTLWHYKAGRETLAQSRVPDFFADAADMLAEGDMIMISAAEGCGINSIAGTSPMVTLLPMEGASSPANDQRTPPLAAAE